MAKSQGIKCGGGLRYFIKRFSTLCTYAVIFLVFAVAFYIWFINRTSIIIGKYANEHIFWHVSACALIICLLNVFSYHAENRFFKAIFFAGKFMAFSIIVKFAHDVWVTEQSWLFLPTWTRTILDNIQQDRTGVLKAIGGFVLTGSLIIKWIFLDPAQNRVPHMQWNVYSVRQLRYYRFCGNIITSVYAIYLSYLFLGYSHMHTSISVIAAIDVILIIFLSNGFKPFERRVRSLAIRHIVNGSRLPITRSGLDDHFTRLIHGEYQKGLSTSPYYLIMREVFMLMKEGYEATALRKKTKIIEGMILQFLCGMPHKCCSSDNNASIQELAFFIGLGCAPTKYNNAVQYCSNVKAVRDLLSEYMICDRIKSYMLTGLVSGVILMLDDVEKDADKERLVSCAHECLENLMQGSDLLCAKDCDVICTHLQLHQSKVLSKEYADKIKLTDYFAVKSPRPEYNHSLNKMQDLYLTLKHN